MAFFRYWNYTTCIESENFNILEQKVTRLLETEKKCRRLSQPPELQYTLNQLLNRPWEKLSNLWIICLFKGANQWTIIKTFPTGILCGRAYNANRPRLSNLTKQIKCSAFHLEVHQDVGGFLFEANAMGHTFLSGCPGAETPDNFKFYDEQQIDKPGLIEQFSLINVPESIQEAIKINKSLEVKRQEAEIQRLKETDIPKYYELIQDSLGYTQRIDGAIADLFDPNRNYWFLKNNLAYKVYSKLGKLESMGARILYFNPPDYYHPLMRPKTDFSDNAQNAFCDQENIPF